jgi:predicted DNA-binding transcriptional regulator AlpA
MDTTVTERKFGSARAPRKAPVANRLFAPCDLASKGIYYHMNHLRKLWKLGKFPEPIRLSPRKIAWRESDLDAWIAEKIKYVEKPRRRPSRADVKCSAISAITFERDRGHEKCCGSMVPAISPISPIFFIQIRSAEKRAMVRPGAPPCLISSTNFSKR